MKKISAIWIPSRPQVDTIVAIFFLKTFGKERFPGIGDARVEVRPTLPEGETFESLLTKGVVAIDMAEGPLDHHFKKFCTSELAAQYLGIEKDPSLAQLLSWSKRDDKEGKGTLSRDPLDRAFGLAGLISALNKTNTKEPQKVVDAALPLIEAHWHSAHEHYVELPREIKEKEARNEYSEHAVRHSDKTLKLVCVASDKTSMPTYLRSERGGKADVVILKSEGSSHYCVLTNQKRGIDLAKVAGLIRMREAQLANILIPEDERYVTQIGRIEEVPHWYYDPMTNSLLNGGTYNADVAQSQIPFDELVAIVKTGLEL